SQFGRNADMYKEREGEEKLSTEIKGNPNLVYESKLVNSFEPTGLPLIRQIFAFSERLNGRGGHEDPCTVLLHYDGMLATVKLGVVLRMCPPTYLANGKEHDAQDLSIELKVWQGRTLTTFEDGNLVPHAYPTFKPPNLQDHLHALRTSSVQRPCGTGARGALTRHRAIQELATRQTHLRHAALYRPRALILENVGATEREQIQVCTNNNRTSASERGILNSAADKTSTPHPGPRRPKVYLPEHSSIARRQVYSPKACSPLPTTSHDPGERGSRSMRADPSLYELHLGIREREGYAQQRREVTLTQYLGYDDPRCTFPGTAAYHSFRVGSKSYPPIQPLRSNQKTEGEEGDKEFQARLT
ncbi:MAG: hypothetical protein Q9184_008128, partial [Pyrenodesmia sp. 2 TL-2023]